MYVGWLYMMVLGEIVCDVCGRLVEYVENGGEW